MRDDLFSKSFDHLLAFVLPGLVFLWGCSYFDPHGLGAWLSTASAADTSLGGFFFIVLAALGIGVFLSGVRWLLLEYLLGVFPPPPRFDDARRADEGAREAYADARHNHFYYHLFYANMACALPVPFVGWLWSNSLAWTQWLPVTAVFVVAEVVLFLSASHAITRFKAKAESILGVIGGEDPEDDQRRLA